MSYDWTAHSLDKDPKGITKTFEKPRLEFYRKLSDGRNGAVTFFLDDGHGTVRNSKTQVEESLASLAISGWRMPVW